MANEIKDDALVSGFQPSPELLERARRSREQGMDVFSRGLRKGPSVLDPFLERRVAPQDSGPRVPQAKPLAGIQPDSTVATTPEQPVMDLVAPGMGAVDSDQSFINAIGNKTMAEMTPSEIQRLIQIQQGGLEQQARDLLGATFEPQLGAARGLESELAAQLEATRASELARQEEEIARSRELLAQTFAPRFEQLARAGERERGDIQTGFSFRGTGRGTRAQEVRGEQLERQAMQESALAAEQALQERLLIAQIRGESDEVIKGISDQLGQARSARQGLEQEQAARQAELSSQLGALGQESVQGMLEALQAQAELGAYDPTLSEATGSIVDSSGRAIINPATGEAFEFFSTGEVPGLDDSLSAQLGYLVDEGRNPITDDAGNPIPYKAGLIGFTKVGNDVVGISKDGSFVTMGGSGVTPGGGFAGGGAAGAAGSSGGGALGPQFLLNLLASEQAEKLSEGQLANLGAMITSPPGSTSTGGGTAADLASSIINKNK